MATFEPEGSGTTGLALDAPYAVLDVETTGFKSYEDRVVEVAVVQITKHGEISGEWSSIVHADGADGASNIHHLPPSARAHAPGFGDIADELLSQLSGRVVVAHNASFDEGFLAAELKRAGRAVPTLPALCSLNLARRALPKLGRHKLPDCTAAHGIEVTDAHTALGDTRALAQILIPMLARVSAPRYPVAPVKFEAVAVSQAQSR